MYTYIDDRGDKMRKAFTLVELIAVIVIMCIILGIASPVLINKLKSNKQSALNGIYKAIETSAKSYAIDNELSYPTTIQLSTLCGEYFECPLIDPTNEEEIEGEISIDTMGVATFVRTEN